MAALRPGAKRLTLKGLRRLAGTRRAIKEVKIAICQDCSEPQGITVLLTGDAVIAKPAGDTKPREEMMLTGPDAAAGGAAVPRRRLQDRRRVVLAPLLASDLRREYHGVELHERDQGVRRQAPAPLKRRPPPPPLHIKHARRARRQWCMGDQFYRWRYSVRYGGCCVRVLKTPQARGGAVVWQALTG